MSIVKQMPRRRIQPTDDMTGWSFQEPHQVTWSWEIDPDFDIERVQTTTYVRHANGRREVVATCDLSRLLDSLAATHVGRVAIYEALMRKDEAMAVQHAASISALVQAAVDTYEMEQ